MHMSTNVLIMKFLYKIHGHAQRFSWHTNGYKLRARQDHD